MCVLSSEAKPLMAIIINRCTDVSLHAPCCHAPWSPHRSATKKIYIKERPPLARGAEQDVLKPAGGDKTQYLLLLSLNDGIIPVTVTPWSSLLLCSRRRHYTTFKQEERVWVHWLFEDGSRENLKGTNVIKNPYVSAQCLSIPPNI